MRPSEPPRICTSIPASSHGALKKGVKKAFESGSDYVEVRFDYLTDANAEELGSLLRPYAAQCVYTCRRQDEGGRFAGGEDARRSLLKDLAEQRPAFVDVELSTAKDAPGLIQDLRSAGSKIIVSWHSFTGTPAPDVLTKVYKDAIRFGDVAKIVTLAQDFRDNTAILSPYRSAETGRLIAFCMGEQGVLSRVLCPLLGSPFTYASLEDETTAPGQISLKELKEFYAAL